MQVGSWHEVIRCSSVVDVVTIRFVCCNDNDLGLKMTSDDSIVTMGSERLSGEEPGATFFPELPTTWG